jgi:signal transduction histidine kinase
MVLQGDRQQLSRVFENLVENAIEAVDRGPGSVTISGLDSHVRKDPDLRCRYRTGDPSKP